jgi:hypothetical protein
MLNIEMSRPSFPSVSDGKIPGKYQPIPNQNTELGYNSKIYYQSPNSNLIGYKTNITNVKNKYCLNLLPNSKFRDCNYKQIISNTNILLFLHTEEFDRTQKPHRDGIGV